MTDPNKIFQEIMGQATNKARNASPNQLAQLEQVISSMDDGLMNMSKGLQTLGQGLDMCHFKINMVLEILVDKGVVTEDELNGHYKQVVQDKINQMRKIQEQKMQEAMMQVEKQAGVKSRKPEEKHECGDCGSCKEEPKEKIDTSHVKLASEQHNKIKF
jgi:hypothetical protein